MGQQESETGRLEAFSDGVFAVAITLLALDIHVPEIAHLPEGGLGAALRMQWPTYLAYVTSFSTILIMWINHDRLFEHIWKKDRILTLLNGLLLMVITLIPFATSLLARYIKQPEAWIAVSIFNGSYFLMALAFNLLWRHASYEGRLLADDHDRDQAQFITDQYRFGPLLYFVIFGVSFINVTASLILTLVLAVYFALPDRQNSSSTPANLR